MTDPTLACYKNKNLALFFQSVVEEVLFGKYILIISLNDKFRLIVAFICRTKPSPNQMCRERERVGCFVRCSQLLPILLKIDAR